MQIRSLLLRSLAFAGIVSSTLAAAPIARAISAPGYSITPIALPDFAQGDVVVAGGSLFVGVGPGFTGAGQSVVRIDGGGTTVVANGFNSLSGFAYDAVNDRLLVTDNGDEALGSETGDSVYSIPHPDGTFATPLRAKNIAVAPAGSIPGASDIVLDPTDPTGNRAFVTDASASFPPAGRLLSIDLSSGALSVLQTGLGFAAGLAADGSKLYIGNVDGFSFAGDVSSVALPGATGARTPVSAGLAGQYDLELASDGSLLSTSLSDLLRIDPTSGVATSIASGFGFATGLFEQNGTIWVLDGGFPGVPTVYRLDLVPEPGTLALVTAGFALLGARRRSAVR
jgi:hypothetical protein